LILPLNLLFGRRKPNNGANHYWIRCWAIISNYVNKYAENRFIKKTWAFLRFSAADKSKKRSAGEFVVCKIALYNNQQNPCFVELITYSPCQTAANDRVRATCNTIIASRDVTGILATYPHCSRVTKGQ